MKQTLQRKFVRTAMTAVTALLLVLLVVINLANWYLVNQQTDHMLQTVLQSLKGILHAVKRAPEPPAQSSAQCQQCCVVILFVHGDTFFTL